MIKFLNLGYAKILWYNKTGTIPNEIFEFVPVFLKLRGQ